jgi:ligand-binding sensor domain-containing protein/signal transduction histidine kinase
MLEPLALRQRFQHSLSMPLPVWCRTILTRSRRLIFAGVAASVFLGAVRATFAASVDYLIDVWETKDSLPSSTVTAITQTPDGYLWIGTYNGLARFDGVRFVTFDPGNTPELGHARVQGLSLDFTGTLWISSYRGGLTSYRDGVFRRERPGQAGFDLHTTMASSSSNKVVFVSQFGEVWTRKETGTNSEWIVFTPPSGARPIFQCAGRDGDLWFVNRDGHVVRFVGGEFKDLAADGGLGTNRVHTVVTDAQGRIWAGADNEIARWNGRVFEEMTPTNGDAVLTPLLLFPTRAGAMWVLDGGRLRKLSGRQWVAEATEWQGLLGWAASRAMGAHEDSEGGVWFNHYGNGLFHITPDGRFQQLTAREGLPGDRVGAWFQGQDGGVWIGVDLGGLVRLRERKFQVIGAAEGLPARSALSVCEDRDSALWIGTSGGGLCRWSEGKLSSFRLGNNASSNFVFSVFPRSDGVIWLSAGESENLLRFNGRQFERAPWDPRGVKAILTDRTGRIWLGTKSGLAWWSEQGRHIFGVNDGLASEDGQASSSVRALAEAPDGTMWCGSDDGTLFRCETERVQAFRPKDGHGEEPIWSLLADEDGAIWAGTFRGGLLRFKSGEFKRFTLKQGLPVETVVQILEDKQGRLWLGTQQGIYSASKAALNACADGKTKTVDFVSFGGLPTLECSDRYQPTCWRGRDGRLWFSTVRGVVSVNPEELKANALPPPVVVEEFRVDGEPVRMGGPQLVVPPGHKQFEFQFTALSFGARDKTRFRYRIDGLDDDWVDAGTRRMAQYGNLPAKDYRFHVIACNNEGVWNESGASVAFTVQPFFYETWWFLTLAGAGIVGGVAVTVRRLATRKYRLKLARLEQQHAIERDRARIAKDIHDDIGAGLTQITLLSELARREPEQAVAHLDRISGSARQLTRAMDEIVWAVDPQHDTFNGLMDYISAYAEDFLRVAGIRCRMDLPNELPAIGVEAELRYNLFLALKEVLNNIVKHAHATEVWLRLRIEPKSFTLVVEDDGCGLPTARTGETAAGAGDRIASGSGLLNLENRLAAIGGRCVVTSVPGKGTRAEMTVNVVTAPSPVVAIGQDTQNV